MAEPVDADGVAFNHVGICVGDLERSRRFYEEALQFRYWWELDVPDQGATRLLQLAGPLGTRAVYLTRDRFVLELIWYADSGVRPTPPRVMDNPGLTHLSLAVADIPATVARVTAHGGVVLDDTDMGGLAIMVRDPDGQLIELTSLQFNRTRPPWPDGP